MFGQLLRRWQDQAQDWLEDSLDQALLAFRRVGLGLAVLQSAVVIASCGLLSLTFSLFCYLAKLTAYAMPALLTGLIGLALGLLVALWAVRIVRGEN